MGVACPIIQVTNKGVLTVLTANDWPLAGLTSTDQSFVPCSSASFQSTFLPTHVVQTSSVYEAVTKVSIKNLFKLNVSNIHCCPSSTKLVISQKDVGLVRHDFLFTNPC